MSFSYYLSILFVLLLVSEKSYSKAILPSNQLNSKSKWTQNGVTIAGGNQFGNALNQLYDPTGISIDDDNQTIYIADSGNDRVLQWKVGEKQGRIIAGGNGRGNGINQLDWPTDVIVEKETNSILICDLNNRRVVRWSLENQAYGQIVIPDVDCGGLKMDSQGNLYVSDYVNNEIRKWSNEFAKGIIVAGGNGKGNQLNQLNYPIYFFVDKDESIYVSDHLNHRVMKWSKNAKEGIVVAGGQGQGNLLTQLRDSAGIVVDKSDNVYIVDAGNNRVVRWSKDSKKGEIIVGGNGKGEAANQFDYPTSLALDRQGDLYVADFRNHRIQKFLTNKN